MTRDIFDIEISFRDYAELKTGENTVKIISFGGKCTGSFFEGEILPGGTDVQVLKKDGTGTVSARYIMQGADDSGRLCKVYIENEGIIDKAGKMLTTPKVFTDCEELMRVLNVELHCRFETREEKFHVIIYGE